MANYDSIIESAQTEPEGIPLTDAEKRYVEYVIKTHWEGDEPLAGITGNNTLVFGEQEDASSVLLQLIEDESSYDRASGVHTVGADLAEKIRRSSL